MVPGSFADIFQLRLIANVVDSFHLGLPKRQYLKKEVAIEGQK